MASHGQNAPVRFPRNRLLSAAGRQPCLFALLSVNFTHFREDFSACIFLPKIFLSLAVLRFLGCLLLKFSWLRFCRAVNHSHQACAAWFYQSGPVCVHLQPNPPPPSFNQGYSRIIKVFFVTPQSLATFRVARATRPQPSATRRRHVAQPTISSVRRHFLRVANDRGVTPPTARPSVPVRAARRTRNARNPGRCQFRKSTRLPPLFQILAEEIAANQWPSRRIAQFPPQGIARAGQPCLIVPNRVIFSKGLRTRAKSPNYISGRANPSK